MVGIGLQRTDENTTIGGLKFHNDELKTINNHEIRMSILRNTNSCKIMSRLPGLAMSR